MNLKYHKTLSPEKWKNFPFSSQILMIANELNRAGTWLGKKDITEAKRCYERAFELLWLTGSIIENKRKLRELLRFEDVLAAHYILPVIDRKTNERLLDVLSTLDPESYRLLHPHPLTR